MHRLLPILRGAALLGCAMTAAIVISSWLSPAVAETFTGSWSEYRGQSSHGGHRPPSWPSAWSYDADRDGLANWIEVDRTGTDWRRWDTDADGFGDGVELLAESDPLDPASVPDSPTPAPEPEITPPETSIDSGPSGSTAATTATFAFSASGAPASFACRLDSGNWTACTSPETYDSLAAGPHTFAVRATDGGGNVDASPASQDWTVQAPEPPPLPEPPPSPEPPQEPSGCAPGATMVTSTSAVESAVAADQSVCITADIGDLDLSGLGDRTGVVVSSGGGSIGHLEIDGTSGLMVRSARLRSVTMRGADRTAVEDSTIGGTAANRVTDQLIFMPDQSNDVVIRDNDIGWTSADDSGNAGYGCRCYGRTDRLRFVGNVVHDIAADGFQGTNGSDVLIDRNKIGPVGANPGSSEHSDNIQIVGNGPNLRITNNWLYEQGYYDGEVTGNAGSTYIHGGSSNSVLYENNLIQIARGRTEICGLGTGGTSRSNITIRRNTWVEGGQEFSGFPSFEWDCDSGSGNTVEGNVAVDPDGGFAQDGSSSAATFTRNLWGTPSLVSLDGQGNCISANCNPGGEEPIGYRRPSGVDW